MWPQYYSTDSPHPSFPEQAEANMGQADRMKMAEGWSPETQGCLSLFHRLPALLTTRGMTMEKYCSLQQKQQNKHHVK